MSHPLTNLPIRPPTPPRGSASRQDGESISDVGPGGQADDSIVIRTQPDLSTSMEPTPPSSTEPCRTTSGTRTQKRVEWSPWTNYHKAPSFGSSRTPPTAPSLRPIPPSRERKCSKSILKTPSPLVSVTSANAVKSLSVNGPNDFAIMLESVVQQLAGDARSGRLDSYLTLSGAMRYVEDLPDPKILEEKMDLFMHFIRRDLLATVPESGALDTQLVLQTLKVLIVFVCMPAISETLTDDFATFVLDQAISMLKNTNTPKAIITHYMHVLGQQSFDARLMTTDRAVTLVALLDGIETHFKGNGVLGERLLIYQKLLVQARSVMIARAKHWLRHLFAGMMSSVKEIRVRAIAFGTEAGLQIGKSSLVAGELRNLFAERFPSGHYFAEQVERRLKEMVLSKGEGSSAAQIWSVPILLLRSSPTQVESWDEIREWLLVMQTCFNSTDVPTKLQANISWTRLIFAISPSERTDLKMIKVLRQPIRGQLRRRPNDSHSKPARQMALSSLCCLLYYSLRPSANHQQIDLYWKEYVEQIVSELLLRDAADVDYGCRILGGLFEGGQTKPWSENRANETGSIKPEELPQADPKWIRSRAHQILRSIKIALGTASWSANSEGVVPIKKMWQAFVKALAEAGKKEVKISPALLEAMAAIVDLLHQIWRRGCSALALPADGAEAEFIDRFGFLSESTLEALGGHCFTETLLVQDAGSGPFKPYTAATSSSSSETFSPAEFLFKLLVETPTPVARSANLYPTIKATLERCCGARYSNRKRLQLYAQCSWLIPTNKGAEAHSAAVWNVLADLSINATQAADESDVSRATAEPLDFLSLTTLLSLRHMTYDSSLPSEWEPLFKSTIEAAQRILGRHAVLTAVVDPLVEQIDSENHSPRWSGVLFRVALLMDCVSAPQGKHMPRGQASSKQGAAFAPHARLYALVGRLLRSSYEQGLDVNNSKDLVLFLSSVTRLVAQSPASLRMLLLKNIQAGVGVWVEDDKCILSTVEAYTREIYLQVLGLWRVTLQAAEHLPRNEDNTATLHDLEYFFAASLSSRRREIVKKTIRHWNSFGKETETTYPPMIQSALRRLLRSGFEDIDHVNLPEKAVCVDDGDDEDAMSYFDSDEDDAEIIDKMYHGEPIESLDPTIVPSGKSAAAAAVAITTLAGNADAPSLLRGTPKNPKRRTLKPGSPNPRLRHDDSQIDFVQVESPSAGLVRMDSQLLTEHQKEVRSRQQADAAVMFSDLRSSPRSGPNKSKDKLPRLSLSSDFSSAGKRSAEGATTPTLPVPTRGPMDYFIGSSPTPRRDAGHVSALAGDHIVPSSSPPHVSQAGGRADDPPSSPPRRISDGQEDQDQDTPIIDLDQLEEREDGHADCDEAELQQSKGTAPTLDGSGRLDASMPIVVEDDNTPDAQLRSTFEVFVDALPSAIPATPTTRKAASKASHSSQQDSVPGSDDTGGTTRIEDSFMHGPLSHGSEGTVIDLTREPDNRDAPKTSASQGSTGSTKRKRTGRVTTSVKRRRSEGSQPETDRDCQVIPTVIEDACPVKSLAQQSPMRLRPSNSSIGPLRSRISASTPNKPNEGSSRGQNKEEMLLDETSSSSSSKSITSRKRRLSAASSVDDLVETGIRRLRSGLSFDAGIAPPKKRRSPRSSPTAGSQEDSGQSDPVLSDGHESLAKTSAVTSEHLPTEGDIQHDTSTSMELSRAKTGRDQDNSATRLVVGPETQSRDQSEIDEAAVLGDQLSASEAVLFTSDAPSPLRRLVGSLTPQAILGQLQLVLRSVRGVDLKEPELRQIDDVMFEIRKEAFRAQRSTE